VAITLNHTIVPAHDRVAAAKFFAELFGLEFKGLLDPFAPVQVNDQLTLDFLDAEDFVPHHYAFHVDDSEFDAIFARLQARGVSFGSQPNAQDNGEINHRQGGRGVYFRDPNGHSYELLTRV
jgi:catechol 2,3-dioxygenase-like lactoylglutathione lyase family enzyme